jgi:molybdopterin synthase sulfur carrier subunit
MTTRILFFGQLRDAAGAAERMVDLTAETSIDGVIDALATSGAMLGAALRHPAVKVAVDRQIVARSTLVGDAREIAFLPPFSGG